MRANYLVMQNIMKKYTWREKMTVSIAWDETKIQLLKNTVCKGISTANFEVFLHICKRTGLDPFSKQIYAIPRGSQMTIQTSIDGYRLIAERTGKYAPGKEPSFEIDKEGKLVSATSYVKKMTDDGTWHEIGATAYYEEYVQSYNGKPSNFWAKMPRVMLAKCAESLALRRAFPSELSGIHTEDEMKQADVVEEAEETLSFEDYNKIIELIGQDKNILDSILTRTKKSDLMQIPARWAQNVIDYVTKTKEVAHVA
jgi:phage recombination protein Bet